MKGQTRRLTLAVALAGLLAGCGGDNPTNHDDNDNGSTGWSSIGDIDGTVHSFFVLDGALLVGGQFSTAGGVAARNVARWDGTRWTALGAGLPGKVTAFAVYHDTLVAGVDLEGTESLTAQWDGTSWRELGGHFYNARIKSLIVHGGSLLVGGHLQDGGIAVWSEQWRWWSGSIGGPRGVFTLLRQGTDLVAGSFADQQLGAVSRWDGGTWLRVGESTMGYAQCLVIDGSDLIAGGNLSWGSALDVARFRGGAWQPLAAGPGGIVSALAVYHGDVVAGGESFSRAPSDSARYVARWDGTTWQTLGAGVNYSVYALAVYDDALIVGGAFTTAGGQPAHAIARWRE